VGTTDFHIESLSAGRLQARGAMTFENAARALQAGLNLIPRSGHCTIDLSGVTEADSAGLAVLVEWLATSRVRGSTIHYESLPAQLLAIARISDLDELLTDPH
jgi:phospholipid transport system transporter-binding protein